MASAIGRQVWEKKEPRYKRRPTKTVQAQGLLLAKEVLQITEESKWGLLTNLSTEECLAKAEEAWENTSQQTLEETYDRHLRAFQLDPASGAKPRMKRIYNSGIAALLGTDAESAPPVGSSAGTEEGAADTDDLEDEVASMDNHEAGASLWEALGMSPSLHGAFFAQSAQCVDGAADVGTMLSIGINGERPCQAQSTHIRSLPTASVGLWQVPRRRPAARGVPPQKMCQDAMSQGRGRTRSWIILTRRTRTWIVLARMTLSWMIMARRTRSWIVLARMTLSWMILARRTRSWMILARRSIKGGGEGGSCRIDNPSRSASSSEGGGELISWDEDEVGFNGGARQQAGGVEEGQADAHQGPYAVLLGSGAATPAPAWQAGCDAVHVCTIQKIAATLSGHESRREPDTVSSFETSTVQLQDAWAQSGEFDDVHPMWKRDGGERRV